MKTFKHFLEEAANAIKSIRDSGFKLKKGGYKDPSLPDGMMRWGWQIKKANLTPKQLDRNPGTYTPYFIRTKDVKNDSNYLYKEIINNYHWGEKAKRRDVTPKEMNKYQKGIYDKYKQITNPVKPA